MTGDELRDKREALGMTQEQLATELKVAPNTVARWERGERSIPPYLDLALETIERNKPEKTSRPPKAKAETSKAGKKGSRKTK